MQQPFNKYDFLDFMTTESDLLKKKALGLPNDSLSLENAVSLDHSVITPLFIDPNSSATQFLVELLRNSNTNTNTTLNSNKANASIEVLLPHEKKFANVVELAVRFGKTLVIQELDCVESILVPLVKKDI